MDRLIDPTGSICQRGFNLIRLVGRQQKQDFGIRIQSVPFIHQLMQGRL
jgi:hypothetical protein